MAKVSELGIRQKKLIKSLKTFENNPGRMTGIWDLL